MKKLFIYALTCIWLPVSWLYAETIQDQAYLQLWNNPASPGPSNATLNLDSLYSQEVDAMQLLGDRHIIIYGKDSESNEKYEIPIQINSNWLSENCYGNEWTAYGPYLGVANNRFFASQLLSGEIFFCCFDLNSGQSFGTLDIGGDKYAVNNNLTYVCGFGRNSEDKYSLCLCKIGSAPGSVFEDDNVVNGVTATFTDNYLWYADPNGIYFVNLDNNTKKNIPSVENRQNESPQIHSLSNDKVIVAYGKKVYLAEVNPPKVISITYGEGSTSNMIRVSDDKKYIGILNDSYYTLLSGNGEFIGKTYLENNGPYSISFSKDSSKSIVVTVGGDIVVYDNNGNLTKLTKVDSGATTGDVGIYASYKYDKLVFTTIDLNLKKGLHSNIAETSIYTGNNQMLNFKYCSPCISVMGENFVFCSALYKKENTSTTIIGLAYDSIAAYSENDAFAVQETLPNKIISEALYHNKTFFSDFYLYYAVDAKGSLHGYKIDLDKGNIVKIDTSKMGVMGNSAGAVRFTSDGKLLVLNFKTHNSDYEEIAHWLEFGFGLLSSITGFGANLYIGICEVAEEEEALAPLIAEMAAESTTEGGKLFGDLEAETAAVGGTTMLANYFTIGF